MVEGERKVRVGIVAIGRDEGDRLVRCLQAIDRQRYPVVYVDSASTDGSAERARAMGAHVVDLDLSLPFTAARARNEGFARLMAAAPQLELVQFIDGDCELRGDWIETAERFLDANPAVAVVCGRRRERFPDASLYNAMIDREWNTPVGEATACGGDAMMRVHVFQQLGGYDPRIISGEEPELCARMRAAGWKIWRDDAEMTLHDAALLRFGQWWSRAIRSGLGYWETWRITRHLPRPLFRREFFRAAIWGGLLPLAIVIAAFIRWEVAVALAFIYPLQTARIAWRTPGSRRFAWGYAAVTMLSKFGEVRGILRSWFSPPATRYVNYKAL
jgi:GT2 family glycosyltransferase